MIAQYKIENPDFFCIRLDDEEQVKTKYIYITSYGPWREKTCLRGSANNTGTDQPAHPCSLISAFVICFLESFICKLATGEISIF